MNQLVFDEDIYNTIRRNIKKYRKQRGLTAAELAERIGRSHDFMRQIESEKVAYNFSVDTFCRIFVSLAVAMAPTVIGSSQLAVPPSSPCISHWDGAKNWFPSLLLARASDFAVSNKPSLWSSTGIAASLARSPLLELVMHHVPSCISTFETTTRPDELFRIITTTEVVLCTDPRRAITG